jgi:hypothetical protein
MIGSPRRTFPISNARSPRKKILRNGASSKSFSPSKKRSAAKWARIGAKLENYPDFCGAHSIRCELCAGSYAASTCNRPSRGGVWVKKLTLRASRASDRGDSQCVSIDSNMARKARTFALAGLAMSAAHKTRLRTGPMSRVQPSCTRPSRSCQQSRAFWTRSIASGADSVQRLPARNSPNWIAISSAPSER